MFWRAALAFVALPGVFAFALPLWLIQSDPGAHRGHWIDLIPLVAGCLLLLWCVRDFYVTGKGTLAPWTPPRHLVSVGLYRFSRNPMYLSVDLILLGWAAFFWSPVLLMYALAVALGFHLRVIFGEEPWLARTHGEEWQRYKERVPRWLF